MNRPESMNDRREGSRDVEKTMRTLAVLTILGLLALALIPPQGEASAPKGDHLQWQASWD